MEKTNHDYEVEEAARTLMRAEEIKMNKKLFVKATEQMKKQMKAMDMVILGKWRDKKE